MNVVSLTLVLLTIIFQLATGPATEYRAGQPCVTRKEKEKRKGLPKKYPSKSL
jgi:hypothetical protein